MDRQEHIEEMVSILAASNNPFVDVPIEIMPKVAEALYNADYRKADEVRKETARGIFSDLTKVFCPNFISKCHIECMAKKYGVEVEDYDK